MMFSNYCANEICPSFDICSFFFQQIRRIASPIKRRRNWSPANSCRQCWPLLHSIRELVFDFRRVPIQHAAKNPSKAFELHSKWVNVWMLKNNYPFIDCDWQIFWRNGRFGAGTLRRRCVHLSCSRWGGQPEKRHGKYQAKHLRETIETNLSF